MRASHIAPLFAALGLLASLGCTEQRPLEAKLSSFEVTLAEGTRTGSKEDPILFEEAPFPVSVTIKALSNKGGPLTSFNGEVAVVAIPGEAKDSLSTLVRATLVDGVGTAEVFLDKVYGRTHVCAEDRYRGPEATFAAGCSETLWVKMPTVQQVQLTSDVTTSPLVGSFIELREGDMMVTGIFSGGFFLTDLAATPVDGLPGTFGSLFAYSFSYPEGLQVGDRLESVIGTVQEFTGTTQLVFPSWVRKPVERAPQDLPAPVLIDTAMCAITGQGKNGLMCGHQDNMALESLEAGIVKIENALTPTTWVDCDFNRDGDVPNWAASCVDGGEGNLCDEIACKEACNVDPTCSELSGMLNYGQWTVTLDAGAGAKMSVLTREGAPHFDPLAEENQGILIDVAGVLRHTLPARPRWVVLSRTADDVVIR